MGRGVASMGSMGLCVVESLGREYRGHGMACGSYRQGGVTCGRHGKGVDIGLNEAGGAILGCSFFLPRTLALRVTASCPQNIVQVCGSHISLLQRTYTVI